MFLFFIDFFYFKRSTLKDQYQPKSKVNKKWMEKVGFKRALVKIRSPPLFKIRMSRNFHEIGTLGFLSWEWLEKISPNNNQTNNQTTKKMEKTAKENKTNKLTSRLLDSWVTGEVSQPFTQLHPISSPSWTQRVRSYCIICMKIYIWVLLG